MKFECSSFLSNPYVGQVSKPNPQNTQGVTIPHPYQK